MFFWEYLSIKDNLKEVSKNNIVKLQILKMKIIKESHWQIYSSLTGPFDLSDKMKGWARKNDASLINLGWGILGFTSKKEIPINHNDTCMKQSFDDSLKLHLWVPEKKDKIIMIDGSYVIMNNLVSGLNTLKKNEISYYPLEFENFNNPVSL